MNKEKIQKLFKDNPIKIIKYGDIEIPVEWLKQTTVNINGDDYIKLQQENQRLKQWDCNKDTRNSRQRISNDKLQKQNKQLKEKYIAIEKERKTFLEHLDNVEQQRDLYKDVIEEIRKTLKLERKTALSLNQAYTVSVIDSVLQILDKGESNE